MSALFIILLSLTITLSSEKVLNSNRCISGLMPNLITKSWTDSTLNVLGIQMFSILEFLYFVKLDNQKIKSHQPRSLGWTLCSCRIHSFAAGRFNEILGLRVITLLWIVRIVCVSTRTQATWNQKHIFFHQYSKISNYLGRYNVRNFQQLPHQTQG